jgi:predicted aldo/keto reductase-like oxidoreductase
LTLNFFLLTNKKINYLWEKVIRNMTSKNNISRRKFLKIFGGGSVAAAAVMAGCTPEKNKATTASVLGEVPTDSMTYRTNPKTGEKVSLLGYGCMRLPTKMGVSGREDKDNDIDQEEVNRLVDYAIAHGVNLFDTSPAYCQGRSEKAMGIALSRHKRSEYFLSTKLSNFGDYSREASLKMYHDSFSELQTDHIDYYLLHAVGGGDDAMQLLKDRYFNNGILEFLLKEREAGRIRNLGFSYHGDIRVFDYLLSLHDEIHWDFVLIQHNYVDWKHAKQINPRNTNSEYLYGELDKRAIPAFVMEPLLGGKLANLSDHATELLRQKDPAASTASWAFRFAGSQPRILSVLSGMTYMEHLQDNIRTYAPLKPLDEEEYKLLEDIAEIFANFPMVPCNTCQYCMPCPYGLDIPGIFSHFNKCLNEGNVIDDRGNKEYRKARKAFLVGYDRSVPRLRQADHCINCKKCVMHCPQSIDIPHEMERINKFVETLKQDGAELGTAVTLAALARTLDSGNYSCVIRNNGETRTFTQRGVLDLYGMVSSNDTFLKNALMADKIVGKGAAALMVLGGVKAMRTNIIAKSAKEMLLKNNIQVVFDQEVDHIENRSKTDWCPLEKRVKDCNTAQACWPVIQQFVKDLKNGLI